MMVSAGEMLVSVCGSLPVKRPTQRTPSGAVPDISELLPSEAPTGTAGDAEPSPVGNSEVPTPSVEAKPNVAGNEAVGREAEDAGAHPMVTDREPSGAGLELPPEPASLTPQDRWASLRLEIKDTVEVSWHVDEFGDQHLRARDAAAGVTGEGPRI